MARNGSLYPPLVANTLRRAEVADAAPYGSIAQRDNPANYGSLFQQRFPALANPAAGTLGNNDPPPAAPAVQGLRRNRPAVATAAPNTLSAPDLFSYFMRQQAMRPSTPVTFNDDQ